MGCANSTPVTEVQPASKTPAAEPAKPAAEPASKPAPASAPAAVEDEETDKKYELDVPEGTKPGAKLKLTIPGRTDKVIITVPEGAVPGSTISFSIPPPKKAASEPSSEEERAATIIQARIRGKVTRGKHVTKVAAAGVEAVKPEDVSPTLEESSAKAAPPKPKPLKKQKTQAEVKMAEAEGVLDVAPALEPETADEGEGLLGSSAKPAFAVGTATVAKPAPIESKPSGWGFLKVAKLAMSAIAGPPTLPASPVEGKDAFELFSVAAAAVAAWGSADFDGFAALSLPNVAISVPGTTEHAMQAVWEARGEDAVDGVLSVDTLMAHMEDEEGTVATVVGIEHCYDIESHGMATRHCWLKLSLVKVEGYLGSATWKIAELLRDPIWPLPTELDAAPEEFRLGMGRTLRGCTDVASLSAVFLTSWLAGDQSRFELLVAPDARVRIKDLGIDASSNAAAYACRDKLLEVGTLATFNSPMIDCDSEPGKIAVLAHAHLHDVAEDVSNGTLATAHFALRLVFTTDHVLTECSGDVLWIKDGRALENEGLSFEQPPLNSIYTRALTFVKAWETQNADAIASMTTSNVQLDVPRYGKEESGIDSLLAYRETLGTLGMLTVDSVNVSKAAIFEANLHEYGIDPMQHGLPRMHAGFRLEFDNPTRDGAMLISRVYLDMEFVQKAGRRASAVFSVPVSNPDEAPQLEASL
jgi:hypothetical protein